MALLVLRDLCLHFAGPAILDHADLTIQKGDRIGLVGRNGMGKSTLLQVIQGDISVDKGTIELQKGAVVASLQQNVPTDMQGRVYDIVAGGLRDIGDLLIAYHHASLATEPEALDRLHHIQHQLEAKGGWQHSQEIAKVISRLDLDEDAEFAGLSGGWKRRVLLARALVSSPDILLLDEPTNHLDIESITWLEKALQDYRGTIIFVTHDRAFLQKLATRIVELDRGIITDWPGDYAKYLERKAHALATEEKQNALFDKKLAQEETWIRQGIKARRTRNEGRVRALKQLRLERNARRDVQGKANIQLQTAEKSGKEVIVAEHISCERGGKRIINDFSTTVMRGDKIGLIGPNGCGKTTLLKCLLKQLPLSSGKVSLGTNLQIAFFDQLRSQLEDDKTIEENVGQGSDTITINGKSKHVIGYLQDFLFSPERSRSTVRTLSGGERNRVLLAKLFAQPANLLILDEPTNDLDIETLELLESLIVEFTGTVLVVSHDREFLNNVVSSIIAFRHDGQFDEYVGGYEDYLRQAPQSKPAPSKAKAVKKEKPKSQTKKLSYNEQRELDALPQKIERLENQLEEYQSQLANPAFYQQPAEEITRVTDALKVVEAELEQAYQRWESLDS